MYQVCFWAQTSQADYEELCRIDVLGLEDRSINCDSDVYEEFKEQLTRDETGRYETGLPWRANHTPLPNNHVGSMCRLTSLTSKLDREGLRSKYNEILQEQRLDGIIESAHNHSKGVEFYIPHKPVMQSCAETTKIRVVYDASARAHNTAPLLNECLHPGPSLTSKLWNVLVRGRFHPIALNSDLQKAFLQISVRESDRDALRFHWQRDGQSDVEILRFARVPFGLAPYPFLLNGVIDMHLSTWEDREPDIVAKLRRELYVDDLGCLPFTSTIHLVSNCANGMQKFRLENPGLEHALSISHKIGKNPEKNRLKSPKRLKRITFLSTPVFLVIFRLGRPKICVPFIFYPELPESLCQW